MKDIRALLDPLRRLHETIRAAVVAAGERANSGELAKVVSEEEGDTIFALEEVDQHFFTNTVDREYRVAFLFSDDFRKLA